MRFMIMVKGNADSEAGARPSEEMFNTMTTYHEELAKAGVLVDAAGLQPTSNAIRIRYSGGRRTVIDGPFTESKELVAGYTLIETDTQEEAMQWARRFPAPMEGGEGEIEVRQLFTLEDFGESEAIQRFRALEAAQKK
jgi:hypothetical protein